MNFYLHLLPITLNQNSMKLIPNLKNLLEKFFFSNREKKEVLSVNEPPLDPETLARLSFYFNYLDHSKTKNELISIKPPSKKPLLLADIFESPQKYEYIMSILVQQGLCSKDTFIWIDSKKGSKKMLVVLMKGLQVRGYYKYNQKLSTCQIQEICFNSFGIEVDPNYIRHIGFQDMDIDFIPLASSLKLE